MDLRVRIEAARRAGFSAFGLLDHDVHRFLETADLESLSAILRDNGMDYLELEFLSRWWTSGEERAASDRDRRFLFTLAERLGAHHVKVAPDLQDLSEPDIGFWAESFHALASDAADHGTSVALEFLPCANVRTLDQAAAIVFEADHPSGGLLLDVWHLERSGADPSDLESLPIEWVLAVELDDGPSLPQGDPYDDTCYRRRLPGDGDFRVAEFASVLIRKGWDRPWGVEIISEEHRHRPLDEALTDVVAKTREQLTRAHAMVALAASRGSEA